MVIMKKIKIYYGRTNAYNSVIFVNETDEKFRIYDENDFYINEGVNLYATDEDEREELIKKLKHVCKNWVNNDELDKFYSMEMGEIYGIDELEGYELVELVSYDEK